MKSAQRGALFRPRRLKPRILHLPTTVGGNPQSISRHLRQLGMDSTSLAVKQNVYGYQADKFLGDGRSSKRILKLRRLAALVYVFRYDVVFFNFGQTLISPPAGPLQCSVARRIMTSLTALFYGVIQRMELFILRARNVVLLVQYQGDDARQGDYCRKNFVLSPADAVGPEYYNNRSDARKQKQIRLMDRYCTRIYALNPDLLHVLPSRAEFLPYSHISLEEWHPVDAPDERLPLRIGHAPTHRGVKGTSHVLKAAERLRREGHQFELVLIEGLSNREAKERYKDVDVLVDQLYAGWYGGLAVELMALGKPVVAYIREDDLHGIPEQMRTDLPIVRADPHSIRDVLESLITCPREDLVGLGRRSRAYVEKWHDPVAIAERIKADIETELDAGRRLQRGRSIRSGN